MYFPQSLRISMVMIIGLMLAATTLLRPCTAFACSCLPSGSVAESVSSSAAVFAGTVTKVDVPQGQGMSSADSVTVTFATQKVWKGTTESQIVVTTSRDSASCGYNFELGQEYLVYANQNTEGAPGLNVSLCSRTTILAQAQSDLAALGEGQAPTGGQASNAPSSPSASPLPSTPSVLPSTGASPWLWITLLFGAVFMVVAAVALRRTRT